MKEGANLSTLKPKLLTTLKDYSKKQFLDDVIAGIIVAVIALPLSIALAIASGVSPEKGLYTAIIAGFFISLLGGSRVQIGGPTGAFMVIVYGIVMRYGLNGLAIATVMAGLIMILMGLLKLGGVIKFIPYPITMGFTSGIAVVIFSSQIKDFFGLKIGNIPVEFAQKWAVYFNNFSTLSIASTFIGFLTLTILILWPRINKRIPGALIGIIITSLVVYIFKLDVPTIGSRFGEISSQLPTLTFPEVDYNMILMLMGPALTIAVLASIESLLSAVVADGMIGSKHRSNMELIALGVANIFSSLFGGIPATGAIARTVANIKNGGRTPIAGIVHALTLLLILLIFMPLAKLIPLASLAAILMVVAYNMSSWREFIGLFNTPKSDVLILLVTFLITVFIDLVKAIEIGMILAALLFMKRMSEVSDVNHLTIDSSEEFDEVSFNFHQENTRFTTPAHIQVYEINGPFFFGAADKFLDVLMMTNHTTKIIVLRMRNVPSIDATALHALRRFIEVCNKRKIELVISGLNTQPKKVLIKSNIYQLINSDNYFEVIDDAIDYANSIV